MSDAQVLNVGAGPTGLVLALRLHRLGVRVRIIVQSRGARDHVAGRGRAGADAGVPYWLI